MSRTIMTIVMLAGIALLVGVLVVSRGSHLPVPDPDPMNAAPSTALPSKMIGRSALSHGGPAPIKKGTPTPEATQSGPAGGRARNSPSVNSTPSEGGR